MKMEKKKQQGAKEVPKKKSAGIRIGLRSEKSSTIGPSVVLQLQEPSVSLDFDLCSKEFLPPFLKPTLTVAAEVHATIKEIQISSRHGGNSKNGVSKPTQTTKNKTDKQVSKTQQEKKMGMLDISGISEATEENFSSPTDAVTQSKDKSTDKAENKEVPSGRKIKSKIVKGSRVMLNEKVGEEDIVSGIKKQTKPTVKVTESVKCRPTRKCAPTVFYEKSKKKSTMVEARQSQNDINDDKNINHTNGGKVVTTPEHDGEFPKITTMSAPPPPNGRIIIQKKRKRSKVKDIVRFESLPKTPKIAAAIGNSVENQEKDNSIETNIGPDSECNVEQNKETDKHEDDVDVGNGNDNGDEALTKLDLSCTGKVISPESKQDKDSGLESSEDNSIEFKSSEKETRDICKVYVERECQTPNSLATNFFPDINNNGSENNMSLDSDNDSIADATTDDIGNQALIEYSPEVDENLSLDNDSMADATKEDFINQALTEYSPKLEKSLNSDNDGMADATAEDFGNQAMLVDNSSEEDLDTGLGFDADISLECGENDTSREDISVTELSSARKRMQNDHSLTEDSSDKELSSAQQLKQMIPNIESFLEIIPLAPKSCDKFSSETKKDRNKEQARISGTECERWNHQGHGHAEKVDMGDNSFKNSAQRKDEGLIFGHDVKEKSTNRHDMKLQKQDRNIKGNNHEDTQSRVKGEGLSDESDEESDKFLNRLPKKRKKNLGLPPKFRFKSVQLERNEVNHFELPTEYKNTSDRNVTGRKDNLDQHQLIVNGKSSNKLHSLGKEGLEISNFELPAEYESSDARNGTLGQDKLDQDQSVVNGKFIDKQGSLGKVGLDDATDGMMTEDVTDYIAGRIKEKSSRMLQQLGKDKRGSAGWEESLRQKPKKTELFQVDPSPQKSQGQKLQPQEHTNETERRKKKRGRPKLHDRAEDVPIDPELEVVMESRASDDPNLGEIVWGKLGRQRWWPAIVVEGHMVLKKQANPAYSWLFWFGDHKISELSREKIVPFAANYSRLYEDQKVGALFQEAVHEALWVCAERCGYKDSLSNPSELEVWAKRGFCDGNSAMPFEKHTFSPPQGKPIPDAVLGAISELRNDVRKSMDSDDEDSSSVLGDLGDGLDKVRKKEKELEEICISCNDSSQEIVFQHPLVVGGMCKDCKQELTESFFAVGDDGAGMFCVICSNGGKMFVCENSECNSVICWDCIKIFLGEEELEKIKQMDPWTCLFCRPYTEETHGYLIPKTNWKQNILKLYDTGYRVQDNNFEYLLNQEKKKIRVLSLFDGIGTGKVILDLLGLEVDVYYTSEIDADSLLVTSFHYGDTIKPLGDVTKITAQKLKEISPIDLLIGGSPCNDLSLANPVRKGFSDWSSTAMLFFDFVRILKCLQSFSDGHHVFWLYENVASMRKQYSDVISRFLECEPALWDAKYFSAQARPRYFWGNIPGMYSTPNLSDIKSTTDLDDVLLSQNCNRKANVKLMRTVTTRQNSLKQGKGDAIFPVTMNGRDDLIWISELERLFGFPDHYTDVGNIPVTKRRQMIGRAWSVPVVKNILHILTEFFAVKEDEEENTSK